MTIGVICGYILFKMSAPNIDTIVSLAKRRGFVFPSSEIYGGLGSAWDYGPLGVELSNNIKQSWWRWLVYERDDIEGIDSSIILNRLVWKYSGHEATFHDPLVDCRECKTRMRADKIEGKCINCGSDNLTEPRNFNMMFRTLLGAAAEEDDPAALAYLRPETAQGIFINFLNVQTAMRRKLPFGIAQVGKSFRNEITPGNFILRTREFEQMEMEYFVEPGTDDERHDYCIAEQTWWNTDLGIDPANLRHYEHPKEKLPHYSKRTVDIEYRFRFQGSEWGELEGIANRTDFDLTTHSKHSGADLSYFDQEKGERWVPYVIEPAAGVTRAVLAFLLEAYDEDTAPNTKGGVDKRTVMRFDPRLAPVKVAVLPLSRNEQLSPKALGLAADLRKRWNVDFDDAGAIGRRYRRQDEIGTPFAVTVDFDTLDDNAVTVRDRDTMAQERV